MERAGQPYHPVAVPFINRALENWGGLNWEDRFHHNDRSRAQRGGIGASLQQGVVMSQKKAETQRLPDACYDVRPRTHVVHARWQTGCERSRLYFSLAMRVLG